MRRAVVFALLGLAVVPACRRKAPPPPDLLAESKAGPVRVEEVEALLRAPGQAGRPAPTEGAPVERYRKAAERLVLERALLAEIKDKDRAVEELGEERESFYRDAVLDLFHLEEDRVKPIRIDEKEARAYYESHKKDFYRAPARLVYHMFRRDDDPARPQDTAAFLAGLKKRAEAGESFGLLARQYSQSETRLTDGRLGTVGRGRLPPPLERVVFSLPKGGISDPIRVPGGAILLMVSDLVEEKQFPFEDVKLVIFHRLWDKKRAERVSAALADLKPPEGSVVLDAAALRRQVESADPGEVILQIGQRKLDVKHFKELFEKEQVDERESLPVPPLAERMGTLYERLRQDALLAYKLEKEGWDQPAQRQALLKDRVRSRGLDLVVRKNIEDRIWKKVDADTEALKRFHQENRFLYQSPLRLKVKTLVAGAGDLPKQLVAMEALRADLEKGKLDLAAAAQRVGGRVTDTGWLGPTEITAMEPKVRAYLLEMNGLGYSVPFQLNRRVNLIFVEKRDEPHLLPFDAVKDRVRQDYRDRHQQDLYQAVEADVLRAQDFRFYEETAKRALGADAPKAAAASP